MGSVGAELGEGKLICFCMQLHGERVQNAFIYSHRDFLSHK